MAGLDPILSNWSDVVHKIQCGDADAIAELYEAMLAGVRPKLTRSIEKQWVEDRFHEILVIVIEAIQRGDVREPERLMGFIRTVAHRRVVAHIRDASRERRYFAGADLEPPAPFDQGPERTAVRRESIERIRKMLSRLTPMDAEILKRFYFQSQAPEQICREMAISPTQFRLHKSRGLARCLELVNRADARHHAAFLARTA
jgi:RNA polymerase sigma-70 factor (ECF subfamily)